MARNYAALPYEYLEEMDELDDAEFGRLCRALLLYSKEGIEIKADGNERFYAKRVMAMEKRFRESYDTTSARNQENGRHGGRPKKNAKVEETPVDFCKTQENPEKPKKPNNKTNNISPIGDINPLNPPYFVSRADLTRPEINFYFEELRMLWIL